MTLKTDLDANVNVETIGLIMSERGFDSLSSEKEFGRRMFSLSSEVICKRKE
jgi:hypothetical protein